MKAKRFNSARIKAFFSAHLEKIALVVFAVVFVWMCYSAFQTKPYDKVPQDLSSTAANARAAVEQKPFVPEEWDVKLPDPPYAKQVESAMQPVDPTKLSFITLFNNPIKENKVRREEPKFLAVRELRAEFGFGAIKPKKDAPLGRQWVVITGLVPIGDQRAEYTSKFDNAWFKEEKHDTPIYVGFEIERAVITSGDPNKAVWEKFEAYPAMQKAFNEFAPERPEVVDKALIEPAVCDRVPPLLGKEPNESMAHPPEIPFVVAARAAAAAADVKPVEGNANVNILAVDEGAVQRQIDERKAQEAAEKAKNVAPIPFHLFRFFDYDVENNKSYRYRVRLVIRNPNIAVPVRFLKTPELATGDTRLTDWSEPSPVATLPPDSRLLAGEVGPQLGLQEQKGKLIIVKWDAQKAVEVSHEFGDKGDRANPVYRGTFLNFPGTNTPVPKPDKPEVKVDGSVDFVTDMLLVDMVGGDSILGPTQKKVMMPSAMLIMGPSGELVIHRQIDDLAQFTIWQPPEPVKVKPEPKDKDDDKKPKNNFGLE